MKHYEDVWREAEKISSELHKEERASNAACEVESDAGHLAYYVEGVLEEPNVEKMTELVGDILFGLARICKEFNINSWTALEKAINDAKIDLYED